MPRLGAGPVLSSVTQDDVEERVRRIFRSEEREQAFRDTGYVVLDLLDEPVIASLWAFYESSFPTRREVVPYAERLPYYISIFDRDVEHKRDVDQRIAEAVRGPLDGVMIEYDVFQANFMIKFAGDGQIEAHQDFNFVDESRHTAFNLWCPLVDTDPQNGGLFVVPGSHRVFRTQRGPNLPRALTEYNDRLRKYARGVPLAKGQAIVFDHRLVHYSPPNRTGASRVAVQAVLTPREATTVHYAFCADTGRVKAHRIDKAFILEHDLWAEGASGLEVDHEQDLIPFPSESEVTAALASLTVQHAVRRRRSEIPRVLEAEAHQEAFARDGFVVLDVLDAADVARLTTHFVETTGGRVANGAYGMYIGLEDADQERKRRATDAIRAVALPRLSRLFHDCKPHLGSFLVKAPGQYSYTYPHQDWTFVDTPSHVSITVWIALVDTDERNGALGFVRGSHTFFDRPVGSPSPEFRTCTQGHETLLYRYLDMVPLAAGQAVAFDNRTIHGASPNRSPAPRVAAAVGMTPTQAGLVHYWMTRDGQSGQEQAIAKLRVDEEFFARYPLTALRACFDAGRFPDGARVERTVTDDFLAFTAEEMRLICESSGLKDTGRRIERPAEGAAAPSGHGPFRRFRPAVEKVWRAVAGR